MLGQPYLDVLLVGARSACSTWCAYLRDGDRVFETYWTTRRGVEAMDYSYALMDLTVDGRQESWEDSPAGWPQHCTNTRTDGGPPDWPPVPVWPGGRPSGRDWQQGAPTHSAPPGADSYSAAGSAWTYATVVRGRR